VRPGPAAHMEGDDVYSSTVGILNESESGVEAKKSKKLLGKGDTVLALVLNESDSFAILSAVTPEDTVAEEGKLLVSSVSREYVKSMRDAIRNRRHRIREGGPRGRAAPSTLQYPTQNTGW